MYSRGSISGVFLELSDPQQRGLCEEIEAAREEPPWRDVLEQGGGPWFELHAGLARRHDSAAHLAELLPRDLGFAPRRS